jgi:putative membrane protein
MMPGMGWGGYGYGMGIFGWLFMLLFWGLIIGWSSWSGGGEPGRSAGRNDTGEVPLDILKRRYARGEISKGLRPKSRSWRSEPDRRRSAARRLPWWGSCASSSGGRTRVAAGTHGDPWRAIVADRGVGTEGNDGPRAGWLLGRAPSPPTGADPLHRGQPDDRPIHARMARSGLPPWGGLHGLPRGPQAGRSSVMMRRPPGTSAT